MRRKILSIMMATAIAVTSFTGAAVCVGTQDVMAAEQSSVQVKLNKTTLNLFINQKAAQSTRLSATVTGSKKGVKWSSSNSDVAKVNSSGKITAVSEGTTVITATCKSDKNAVATCTVTVKKPTKKVTAKKKLINADSDVGHIVFNNLKITSYSQMKKVIKNYEKNESKINRKLLKQLKSYNQSYFKKNVLLLNSVPKARGYKVSVGNVTKKLSDEGKLQIVVDINLKCIKQDDDMLTCDMLYGDSCFVEISKELADMADEVVYNEIRE